jgi:flagellin
MGISVNTNVAATRAGMYLSSNHANLQKSLDRLSSGRRITEPADDAGGLAVSMKLEHTTKVLEGTNRNLANAISLLQVQDGVLKSAGDIVTRIGELKAMYDDVTKNSDDKALYDNEVDDLIQQLQDLNDDSKFNGIAVFASADGASLDVVMDESGTTEFTITLPDLDGTTNTANVNQNLATIATPTNLAGGLTTAQIASALEEIAGFRATNGGEVRRLQYQMANLNTQITNLTAANGRIVDVDIAAESSNLAKQQVLVQASAAMTAQANVANDVALMLLQ